MEKKKLTKEQAEQLAAVLLTAEPRFEDSKLAKVEELLASLFDGGVSRPRFQGAPMQPNPFTSLSSPHYWLHHRTAGQLRR